MTWKLFPALVFINILLNQESDREPRRHRPWELSQSCSSDTSMMTMMTPTQPLSIMTYLPSHQCHGISFAVVQATEWPRVSDCYLCRVVTSVAMPYARKSNATANQHLDQRLVVLVSFLLLEKTKPPLPTAARR